MKHIRDPLYGYISVSDAELGVIGTPAVQRLRGIHQLGLSSAVYPGATHTRFEHSLGVMHLAGKFAESVGLTEAETQAYRLAGLLHDVGHAPFSHATERIMEEQLGISHEEQSCRVVEGIATSMGDDFPADPSLVKAAIRGDSQYNLVAGDVDADRMDYLRRDADKTGIPHGEIDAETIIRFAEIHEGDIVFDYKSLQAIEDLFNARAGMNKSVYQHHASKIVEAMLHRAVEQFLEETGTDPEVLLRWDDRQLHTHLLEHDGVADKMYRVNEDTSGEWTAPLGESSSNSLYGRITARNLYKRAFTVGVDEIGYDGLEMIADKFKNAHSVERDIATHAGVTPSNVIVDFPQPPTSTPPSIGILMNDEIRCFSDISTLHATIAESEWRTTYFAVYAPLEHRDVVSDAAESVMF